METVGDYLKKERESKNISLGEVSRLTKISEIYLDYIEKDEFEKLPQGPYTKGYIASYSRMIGGNVDEAILLYESLNKKSAQTEAIQPLTPKNNGRPNLNEKPEANGQNQSNTFPAAVAKSSLETLATYLMAKIASLKALAPTLKTIGIAFEKMLSPLKVFRSKIKMKPSVLKATGASIQTMGSVFKKTALSMTTNRWFTRRRIWLNACVSLFGVGILVLSGFGFYHLFIYDQNPLSVAEFKTLKEKEALPPPAIGSEKSALPPASHDATSTTSPLERHEDNKELTGLTNPPQGQQQSSSLSVVSDESVAHKKLKSQNSIGMSKPEPPADTPVSGLSSTSDHAATSRTAAGTPNRSQSDQSRQTAGPSPEPTTANANLSVSQAIICSAIKDRMPAGVDTSFSSSVQRIYVWNEIETKQLPSKIRHIYYFKGQKISDVTLDVRAPYWRTWSYKNIADDRYRGEWKVDIALADGKVLRRLYFKVR